MATDGAMLPSVRLWCTCLSFVVRTELLHQDLGLAEIFVELESYLLPPTSIFVREMICW